MLKLSKTTLTALISTVIASALMMLAVWQNSAQAKHSKSQKLATVVTSTIVKQQSVAHKIEAIGTAKANETVKLSSTVTERVSKVNFEDGMLVKKGMLLVQLVNAKEKALLNEAQAKLNEMKKHHQRIVKLERQHASSKSDLDKAYAQLEAAKANVAALSAQLKDHEIVAPFTGIIDFRKISPGALLEPGEEIATLDDTHIIKVDFSVPERYLANLKKGQKIIATSSAFPNKPFIGKIATISSRIDASTRSVTIRALIDNQNGLIRPGMLLSIDIILFQQQAILAPEAALVPIGDQQFIFTINTHNQVTRQAVQIGQRQYGDVVIRSGLQNGQRIVVNGGFKLKNGQTVRILNRS